MHRLISYELSRTSFPLHLGRTYIKYRSSKLNGNPPVEVVEYLQHGVPGSGNAGLVLEDIDSQKWNVKRTTTATIISTNLDWQLKLL